MTMTATYSPEDNKLRLYSTERLPTELYQRVRGAGFIWAPRQQLFVAPMWTPDRADLLTELCGDIGDEDTSLVQRAEERAERFEEYRENRTEDAHRAHQAVAAIADNIPLGQPILVGHHSERHARKDAEKIEAGMRRAVKMWETAQYWKDRAAGAIHHAKYLERPDVRHRRIKGLESDIRIYRAKFTPDPNTKPIMQHRWSAKPGDPEEPHVWCSPARGGRGGSWVAVASLPALERHYTRWIQHCELRLTYERAMLAEDGGPAQEKFNLQPGGRALIKGEWLVVIRVNKSNGAVNSVTTAAPAHVHWCKTWKYGVEVISDYKPPEAAEAAKVKALTKLPPMCNYPGEGFRHMTRAEWDRKPGDYKGSQILEATDKHGRHRVRKAYGYGPGNGPVYLSDEKRKDPPAPTLTPDTPPSADFERQIIVSERPRQQQQEEPTIFDQLKDTLKAGVKVVTAPQLFPTPPELARRMCDEAGPLSGLRILEPSAGTGNIVRAIFNNATGPDCCRVVAIEQNYNLVQVLDEQRRKTVYANDYNFEIHQADFLECNGDLGQFHRVLMNPPFENGADIKHIKHALTFLKSGGLLVAICAGGSRQREFLEPLAELWEPLPEGTFKESGTAVNTVLLTIRK